MTAAQTWSGLFADLIVLIHFAFVVFVIFGGLLAARWRAVAWGHPAAVVWAAFIEFSGWICPLTPLENWLRAESASGGYESDFVAHYILPVLYPDGLTRATQIALGCIVVAINLAVYAWIFGARAGRNAP